MLQATARLVGDDGTGDDGQTSARIMFSAAAVSGCAALFCLIGGEVDRQHLD
jgi:hypothetical protein